MTLLQKLAQKKGNIAMHRWTIKRVLDENTLEPKYTNRNRIGATVRVLRPLALGVPLHLLYDGGPKDGGIIEHSRIKRLDEPGAENVVVVTTQGGTMIELEFVPTSEVEAGVL